MSDLLTPQDVEAKARAVGLSIADVCKKANVAQSTFTRWKRGVTSPTLAVCKRMIDAINAVSSEGGAV